MGESKYCVLTIFAALKDLACLEQEMTQVIDTSKEAVYNNTTLFFIKYLNFRLEI